MESLVNRILCAELYMIAVAVPPIKLILKIPAAKLRLIRVGLLKMSGNEMDLSRYYDRQVRTVADRFVFSRIILHGVGLLPFWLLICKTVLVGIEWAGITAVTMVLSFGIPLLLILMMVSWEGYWEQTLKMPSHARRKQILLACLVKILFLALYVSVYIICMPYVKV